MYESNLDALVLFGGLDNNYRADTWLFGLKGRYQSGTYTSAPHDTGGKAYFGNLKWQSSAPANTSVKLQFRTGSSPADMQARPFTGPDGTADTYFVSSGQSIPAVHNGSRWMQYRAYLESGELLKTPSVPSVTVDCNLLHSANIVSPVAGDNWTGSQWIRWTAADPDGDALLVDLYLVNETGAKETLAISVPSGAGQFQWDNTLASPNGTYRISLVARDLSPSIPLAVETTSGQFTLFHNGTGPSGPNHPPFVIMRSPADGASLLVKPPASVMLEWNGSDPDGDDLEYTIYISSVIFNLSSLPLPAAQTARSNFSASALSDNTTYYWTVIASDRKAVSNGSVWKFSVKFGSPNIPPRITSLPPANATVGEQLVYQVTAVDEDSGNITFSLTSSVEGMAIDPVTGRLNWTPRPFQTGDFPVALKASDGQGGYAEQKFIIIVGEPPVRRPTCHILLPKDKSLVRGTFWVNGSAANGTYGIVRLQVRIDQRGWKDAGRAAGNWSVQLDTKKIPNGAHTIEARAYDGRNYSDYASVAVNVRNPERNITIGTDPAGLLILAILFISALVLAWQQFGRKGAPPPPV